ncbi:MAG: hypothetical protein COA79_11010 [Planctomycetota bacterium]|nr:MAG: hypothetical protein COA79_11010 [Planctomycetota bacterium]
MSKKLFSKLEKELSLLEKAIIKVLRSNYSKKSMNKNAKSFELTNVEQQNYSNGLDLLRNVFVENPGAKEPNYLRDLSARSSYIYHYIMPNVQRWMHAFMVCRTPDLIVKQKDVNILDIGAGPATATISFLLANYKNYTGKVKVFLTDYNQSIMKDGKFILEELAKNLKIDLEVHIHGGIQKGFPSYVNNVDFVLMGNVWNEGLSSHKNAQTKTLNYWVDSIKKVTSDNARFLFMEPANRRSSRLLMAMRDYFSTHQGFSILAPCPSTVVNKPCTLNKIKGRPWCHFGFDSFDGFILKSSSIQSGISHERLSYSYLWLSFKDKLKSEIKIEARAIGGPMKIENGFGVYVCHKNGRVVLESQERRTLPVSGQSIVKGVKTKKVGVELRGEIIEKKPEVEKKPFINPNKKITPKSKVNSKKVISAIRKPAQRTKKDQ